MSRIHDAKNKMRINLGIVLSLSIILLLLLLCSGWNHSYSYNENGRLASGLFYLKHGEFSIFHVNPPLVTSIGAIPSAIGAAHCPERNDYGFSTFGRYEYQAGTLFDKYNDNHRLFIFLGRSLCILLVIVCVPFYFKYTTTLFCRSADSIALLILVFSPWVLGYSPLIIPDVFSALFALLSLYGFRLWLKEPHWDNVLLAGLILGLAELTKFTLIIFYPLFIGLWIIYRWPEWKMLTVSRWLQQAKQLFFIFVISLFVINMGYLFEGTGKQLRDFKFQTTLFSGCETLKGVPRTGGNRFNGSGNILETALGYLPIPLPANYIQGIDTQRLDFERGLPSYLRGQWSDHGWWYYYLYALLIKTPLGTICLFLLAIYCTFLLKGYNAPWRDEMVVLLPGITLLVFVSSQTGFSVHSRYVIPALPFFFVWMSKVGRAFTGITLKQQDNTSSLKKYPHGYKTVRVLTVVFLVWSVLSSLSVYPHSISYFNELAVLIPTSKKEDHPQIPPIKTSGDLYSWYKAIVSAGPRNGPRHLLDSNIDWGQDLFFLERWCKKHPEIKI